MSPPGSVLEGVSGVLTSAVLCWQPGQVPLSSAAGTQGGPAARDMPGRGQDTSITVGRAAGAGQCCSMLESRLGLPGVPSG